MAKFDAIKSQLREYRRLRPFRPFKIVMSTGEAHPVRKPLWFAFNQETILVLPRPGATGLLKFRDVVSVEPIGRKKNNQSKKE